MEKNLPAHIAIIPDGNRRWAEKNSLLPWEGHACGVKTFREIVDAALRLEIPYVTFWAASEANLVKRSEEEVRYLVYLLHAELTDGKLGEKLRKNKTRLRFIGRWEEILGDQALTKSIRTIEEETSRFKNHHLTILFGYDGKREMLEAIRKIQSTPGAQIDHGTLKSFLWTKDLPPVDLTIRTGEEDASWSHWSSGFMMWDVADAELYFTKTLWPEFSTEELSAVLAQYEKRRRMLGS